MKKLYKVLGIGSAMVLALLTSATAAVLPAQLFTPLQWDASPGASVAGYAVYYTVTGLPITNRLDAGAALTATIPLLVGSGYSIFVVAYGSDGLESDPSNVVSYTPNALTKLKMTLQTGNTIHLKFRTSPLAACSVEYSSKLNPAQWQTLTTTVADVNGDVVVDDSSANRPETRFYRAVRL